MLFRFNEPDDDGDMHAEFAFEGANDSEHSVRRIRYSVVLFNGDGAAFSSSKGDEDVRVESGESFDLSPHIGWIKESICGDSRDNVTCRLTAHLYRRELIKLGEAKVKAPGKSPTVATLSHKAESETVDPDIRVLLTLMPPDDDGDVRIEGYCGVRNLSDKPIDTVLLKSVLLDEDDMELGSDDSTIALDIGETGCIEFSMWGVKKNVLKSARMRFTLSLFHRVDTQRCEAVSTPA